MTARAKIGDAVALYWLDAWANHEVCSQDSWRDDPMLVVTYGVLRRNGGIVSVAGENFGDGLYRCVTHVPRGNVKRIRRLEEV